MSEQTHHQQQELFLLLRLFDSFWSEFPIFTTKPPPSPTSLCPPLETTLDAKVERVPETSRPSKFPTALHSRSMSETDVMASPVSPDSVLSSTPKLETVLSGKEAETAEFYGDRGSNSANTVEEMARPGRREGETGRRRSKRRGIVRTSSRSLSELEFEELKGFTDLGFVFSERDRDSATLVSIIPGLQRLDVSGEVRTAGVSRPYLSEVWAASERQRKAPPKTKWRIPEIGKEEEMAMKDQLRFWAQAVASAVR